MLKGLYSAASGMAVGQRRTDTISNNLSNASTPGFKRELVSSGNYHGLNVHRVHDTPVSPMVFQTPFIGALGTGVSAAEAGLDPQLGMIERTDRELDVALDGPGLFVVELGAEVGFSRRGDFRRDQDGILRTGDGATVLGIDGGAITIPEQGRIIISTDGAIQVVTEEDTVDAGILQMVEVANPAGLAKTPAGLLQATAQSGDGVMAETTVVRQGHLERSNAHPVVEMVELMSAFRIYEANQKALQALDEALGQANRVGRLM